MMPHMHFSYFRFYWLSVSPNFIFAGTTPTMLRYLFMVVEELVNFFDVNYASTGVTNPNNTVIPTHMLPLRTGNGVSKSLASDLENKVKTTQVAMTFMGQEDVVREVFCSRAMPLS